MAKDIEDIILARLSNEPLTEQEEVLFEAWYAQTGHPHQYYELRKLQSAILAESNVQHTDPEQNWHKMKIRLHPRFRLNKLLAYAAIALLLISLSVALHFYAGSGQHSPLAHHLPDVLPENQQAILTLSNGQEVPLSTASNRLKEQGAIIQNNSGNSLEYQASDTLTAITYNNLRIPRGGEYQLKLTDGTLVWLNAESSLTFPVVFSDTIRSLTLEGEAYFKVAPDTLRPFIVHTSKFDVQVTGTEFNVRTYPEDYKSATLITGGICLSCDGQTHLLLPEQQFRLKGNTQEIISVDPEVAVAWRYNIFNFKEQRLENLLNELARWYDLDVIYLNQETKDYHFTAWFKRSSTIGEVIEILEKTKKIKLQLQGKVLTVTK